MSNEGEEENLEEDVWNKFQDVESIMSDIDAEESDLESKVNREKDQEQNGAEADKLADEIEGTIQEDADLLGKEEEAAEETGHAVEELIQDIQDLNQDISQANENIAQGVEEIESFWNALNNKTGSPNTDQLIDGAQRFRSGIEELHQEITHYEHLTEEQEEMLKLTGHLTEDLTVSEKLTQAIEQLTTGAREISERQHDGQAAEETEKEMEQEQKLESEANHVDATAEELEELEEQELEEFEQLVSNHLKTLSTAENGVELLEKIVQKDTTLNNRVVNFIEETVDEGRQVVGKDRELVEKAGNKTKSMFNSLKDIAKKTPKPSKPSRKTTFALGKWSLALVGMVLVFLLVAMGIVQL